MTLEAPDEALRRRNGKFACSNAEVEATIEKRAFARVPQARRLLHGRPAAPDLRRRARHRRLLRASDIRRFGADGRFRPYVAPLAPFLDPGSRAFEHPELGVTLFCRTLEDHRRACLQNGWQRVLSYETDAMTRDQIAAATYEVASRLNAIKHRHGLIDDRTYAGVEYRLGVARQVMQEEGPWDARRIDLANHATMFGDDELKSPLGQRFRVGANLLWSLAAGLAIEAGHTAARRSDVTTWRSAPPDLDPRVDDAASVAFRQRDDRVEIQLDDLGHFIGQSRHAKQNVAERVDVGRRLAAIAREQAEAADLAHQFVRVVVGQRRDAESDVAYQFDVDPAEAEADERAEQAIGGDADHRLDAAGQHRLDEHAVHGVEDAGLLRPRQDVVERAPDRRLVLRG